MPCSPDWAHSVHFNGWREPVTVQVSRPLNWVVVAHLVAQSRKSLIVSLRRLRLRAAARVARAILGALCAS